MQTALIDVLDFHKTMKQSIGNPAAPDVSVDTKMRVELIREEFHELKLALDGLDKNGNRLTPEAKIVAVADALGDICYVTVGAAVAWGIDIAGVWDAIHKSNMTKSADNKRFDGKILKGAGYKPPQIHEALEDAKKEVEVYGFGQDTWWPTPTVLANLPGKAKTKGTKAMMKSIDPEESFFPVTTTRTHTIDADTLPTPDFGKNQLPGELASQILESSAFAGVFLARGAYLFDCECKRTHEVNLQSGSRGGRVTEGHKECICGKVYDFQFSIQNGKDFAHGTVTDLGGPGPNK